MLLSDDRMYVLCDFLGYNPDRACEFFGLETDEAKKVLSEKGLLYSAEELKEFEQRIRTKLKKPFGGM